jgi:hypothetical protein
MLMSQLHCVQTLERNMGMIIPGVPRPAARQMTGDLSESVYIRYDIFNEADKPEGIRKLETRSSLIEGSRKARVTSI